MMKRNNFLEIVRLGFLCFLCAYAVPSQAATDSFVLGIRNDAPKTDVDVMWAIVEYTYIDSKASKPITVATREIFNPSNPSPASTSLATFNLPMDERGFKIIKIKFFVQFCKEREESDCTKRCRAEEVIEAVNIQSIPRKPIVKNLSDFTTGSCPGSSQK